MTKIARPSVASLFLQMSFQGQNIATGTGFVSKTKGGRDVLVTNRHNLTGCNQQTGACIHPMGAVPSHVAIAHNAAGALGSWIDVVEPLYSSSGQPLWIQHPQLGDAADVVALPLTNIGSVELYRYDPANPGVNVAIGPADVVSIIGFPFGRTGGGRLGLWVTGFVASEPQISFDGLPVFLVDSRSRPGQSGSPVIAYRSGGAISTSDGNTSIFTGPVERFLGIYSGRISEQSDLGMVWKAEAIAQLLSSA
jgi:hypothetical protein